MKKGGVTFGFFGNPNARQEPGEGDATMLLRIVENEADVEALQQTLDGLVKELVAC